MLEGEYWGLGSESGMGEVGVGEHKKKEVRLLTLPPMVVNYHAVYFVLRMNTLC